MNDLLGGMVTAGASDLHISAGSPPAFRIDGRIRRVTGLATPTAEETRKLADAIMTPEQAMNVGVDYLVIGRPITKAENPQQVLQSINASLT